MTKVRTQLKKPVPVSWKELRDAELAESLADSLRHDSRTSDMTLSVEVRGSVAHVAGVVGSESERQMLRRLLRRQKGIYAVWDLLEVKDDLTVVDIGCGDKKQVPEAVGVDRFDGPEVEVVTDLEKKLPFEDNYADHVFAVNILEHIYNLTGLMNELHRIIRPSGVLHAIVPHWQDVIAVADPTHVKFFDKQTFKYFCEPHTGLKRWQPLVVSASNDTVFADLAPVKSSTAYSPSTVARWFD